MHDNRSESKIPITSDVSEDGNSAELIKVEKMLWLRWASKLQSLCQAGLFYSKDPYDIARYNELKKVVSEIYQHSFMVDPQEALRQLDVNIGYATPKVDVRAACFIDGRILLVRERSCAQWCLPGGWVDVGEQPSTAVVRELEEESGVVAQATKLLAVFDGNRVGEPLAAYHAYKLFFNCVPQGRVELSCDNVETDSAALFGRNELPELSVQRSSEFHILECFKHLDEPGRPTWFD